MDQNQIQRLLLALREEVAAIRKRQEEQFELLLSYKDQIQDLKTTVVEKLSGLPKSPYIAGMLVPAPNKTDGVDEFRHLLATYLHKNDGSAPDPAEKPADLVFEKPPEVKPDDIELEPDETERPRRREGGDRGGGAHSGDRPRRPRDKEDNDLQRGPERDVEPFDLNDDADDGDDDEGAGGERSGGGGGGDDEDAPNRRRRRRRGGRGRRREGSGGERSGGGGREGGGAASSAPAGDA